MSKAKDFTKNAKFPTYYLRITAGVTFFLGFALLISPGTILQWFIPGASGDFFIRFIGSALIGFSFLNYLASKSKDITTYKIALDSNIVALSIATVLSVAGVVSGEVKQLGWLIIVEHVVFLLAFIFARKIIR